MMTMRYGVGVFLSMVLFGAAFAETASAQRVPIGVAASATYRESLLTLSRDRLVSTELGADGQCKNAPAIM